MCNTSLPHRQTSSVPQQSATRFFPQLTAGGIAPFFIGGQRETGDLVSGRCELNYGATADVSYQPDFIQTFHHFPPFLCCALYCVLHASGHSIGCLSGQLLPSNHLTGHRPDESLRYAGFPVLPLEHRQSHQNAWLLHLRPERYV